MLDSHSTHSHSCNHNHFHGEHVNIVDPLFQVFTLFLKQICNTLSCNSSSSSTKASHAFTKLLLLTFTVAILQLFVGLWNNNLLLLVHSAHSTFDSFQLVVALISQIVNEETSTTTMTSATTTTSFSYGLHRLPVLGTFANATLGILVSLYLLVESLHRYSNGTTSFWKNPTLILSLTFLSLGIKIYGIYIIQNVMNNKHLTLFQIVFRFGATCKRRCSQQGRAYDRVLGVESMDFETKNNRLSNINNNNTSLLSSVNLILTMIVGDVIRSIGIVIGLMFSSMVTQVDVLLSWLTCAFMLISIVPIFNSTGNMLLNRSPVHLDHDIENCLRLIKTENGVLDIVNQHFWTISEGMVVGSISILVDQSIEEQEINNRVHAIFQPMKLHLLTVEVSK